MAHISEAAPLQISRFYTGLFTHRNPLIVPIRQMGRRIIELYDALSDGFNMEPTNRLTLARRPGYTILSPTPISGRALNFFTFKPSNFPGQIYPIIDTTTVVAWFQANHALLPDAFVTLTPKFTPALTNFSAVGAYTYIAQELIALKWDSPGGVQGVTQWGIDMYDPLATQGPNSPTSVTNLPSKQAVPFPWTISGGGGSVDLSRAPTDTSTILSGWLSFTGFNFVAENPGNIYTDLKQFVVSGFQVELQGVSVQGEGDFGLHVRLLRNGELYGTFRTVTCPPNGPNILIGRPADLWDGTWTVNDILQSNFGVAVQAVNSSSTQATFSLTGLVMTVEFNRAPLIGPAQSPVPPPNFVAETGYRYQYCYGNSHSGHISSPTPPSFYEGGTGLHGTLDGLIVPNGQFFVELNLIPSNDPQVTDIHVYRTTDGGGLPFFELPGSPTPNFNNPAEVNGIITIADATPDTDLQIGNICPDQHFNDPPPGGCVDPVWYAGRLWMHRGNQLFFASGPDVTMGNGEEAWYPVYVFALPHGQIVRKFATPNGLLLVGTDEIPIVRGISTQSFTVVDFVKDIGMRKWTAADTDGSNVYLYSSDRQFLLINPNGFTSISANIADVISAVDPTKAYVSMFRYTAQENWIFLADGSTTVFPYNQELGAWATKQLPVNGIGAIGTVETAPGVFQFWRSRPVVGSLLSFRDLTTFADEGLTYPCQAIFGPIPVADFLTLAQLRDIALAHAATTSEVIVSVLPNEIFPVANSQYQILRISSSEPPELSATPSLSFHSNRYTWKSAPLPELVNLCFLRMDFSADANPDELFNWTLGGTQTTGGSSLGAPGQLPQLQGR